MTRTGRGRAVIEAHRRRLRKRYAAIAALLAIPAMAGATDWGTASPDVAAPHPAPYRTAQNAPAGPAAPYITPASLAEGGVEAPLATGFADEAIQRGPAARAFLSAGSPSDRARAEQCLAMAVYYEAATESDAGQRAVAQVVLNRVAHPSYPDTVCGVVFQGSERSTGCQFTFTCDGSLARKPAAYWWDRARRVARDALDGAVFAPVGLATHYHTLDVHPYWDASLAHVTTIGAHTFFRWRGAAGLRSAFSAAYLGGEPTAAPHPRAATPAPADEGDPVQLARAFEAAQPVAAAPQPRSQAPAPVYAEAVEAHGGEAQFRAANLPAGGVLSPELQRSGQWLARPGS